MMNRLFQTIHKHGVLCLLPLWALTACQPSKSSSEKEQEKPVLTVAIEPLRYFTEAIAGPYFTVRTLVPSGASPETYDPTPRQLVELAGSAAFLRTGYIGFEQVWTERLQAAAPQVPFVNLSEGIRLIREEQEACEHADEPHTHHHHHAGGVEPHTWTTPENASIISRHILQTLCRLDTLHQAYYQAKHDSLQAHIQLIDSLITKKLEGASTHRSFLIYHPSLSYFARQYGLQQIPIENQGKEPSPETLSRLVALCRTQQVGVIFIQPEFDVRHAEVLAQQTGTRLVRIHPLAYQWDEEMLHVAENLGE